MGVVGYGLPREEYEALEGVSNSQLRDFARHPRIYYGRHVARTLSGPSATPAMQFGRAVEEALWGQGLDDSDVAVIPAEVLSKDGHRRGNAYTDWAKEQTATQLLKQEEYDALYGGVKAAVRSIESHSVASGLLLGSGDAWVALQWTCIATRIPRKGEIDILTNAAIVDLKTCADTSPEAIAKSVLRFDYHCQMAGYQEAIYQAYRQELPCILVCVRNAEPWDVACYELSDDFLDLGRDSNVQRLRQLHVCQSTNIWERPGSDQILTLQPPRWAKYLGEYDYVE